jgi:hypothetical protein
VFADAELVDSVWGRRQTRHGGEGDNDDDDDDDDGSVSVSCKDERWRVFSCGCVELELEDETGVLTGINRSPLVSHPSIGRKTS